MIEYLESDSDLELAQNKSQTKTEALHCLQTIRNYLIPISKTTDVDYSSLYNAMQKNSDIVVTIAKKLKNGHFEFFHEIFK